MAGNGRPKKAAGQPQPQGTAKPQGAATGSVQGKGKVNISQNIKGQTASLITQIQQELDSLDKQGYDTAWYQSMLSWFDRAFGNGQSARKPATHREQVTSATLGSEIAKGADAIHQAVQGAAQQKAQAAQDAQAAFQEGAGVLTEKEINRLADRVARGESIDTVLKSGNNTVLLRNMVNNATKAAEDAKKGKVGFTDEQMTRLNQMALDGASQDAIKLQMLRFKMLNDYTNPESDAYKSLTESVLSEYQDKVAMERQAAEKETQTRVKDSLARYAMPKWVQAAQVAAAFGGGIASIAGNTSSLYRNGLANALMNVANMGTPGISAQRKAAFGDPLEGLGYKVAARAQKQKYVGDRNKMIGDTINRVLNQIVGGIVAEKQQQRQYRALLEEHPSGLFYQTNWNWGKYPQQISRTLQ